MVVTLGMIECIIDWSEHQAMYDTESSRPGTGTLLVYIYKKEEDGEKTRQHLHQIYCC